MNLVVLLLMVVGLAFFLFSLFKPARKVVKVTETKPNNSCNEVDYLFQRNLKGGILDTQDRRNQLYDRMAKLVPMIKDLNGQMEDIYKKLDETERDAKDLVPDNMDELEYQYGQKLITKPFEDLYRPENGIPNFERPTFWKTLNAKNSGSLDKDKQKGK